MTDEATPDLTFIGRRPGFIASEIGGVRDNVAALTTSAMRQDGTLGALLTGIRPMHPQHSRLANRTRALETASEEKL